MTEHSKYTLTKKELSYALHSKTGYPISDCAILVDLVFEKMKKFLSDGHDLKLSGYGNFRLRDKKSRRGRNPQTGVAIEITKRRVVSFSASQVLRQLVANAAH